MSITTMSLLQVFEDYETSSITLENRPNPHLKDAPNTVWLAIWGGYRILVRWSPLQKRMAIHRMAELAGPEIHHSNNDDLCVVAKASVPLLCLVQGLLAARVPSVILVHFGMKRPLRYFSAFDRATLTSVCPNRYDIGYNVHNETIPALTSPVATVRPMYVEAGRGGGSLEIQESIQGVDVTIKVYPLIMHPLKSLVSPSIAIPKIVKGMRNKVVKFQSYLEELRKRRLRDVGGYRVEMCVVGNIGMRAAVFVANRIKERMVANEYHLQVTAELRMPDYMDTIKREIDRCTEVCRGANTKDLTRYQKCVLARLFNASGYNYEQWYRHVHAYAITPTHAQPESTSPDQPSPEHSIDPSTLHELAEARRCLRTRTPARNRTRLCAIYLSGGCTTSFPNLQELAQWAVNEYEGDWRQDFRLEGTPQPPLKGHCHRSHQT